LFKNRHAPDLNEANSHSKQLLKTIINHVTIVLFSDESIITVAAILSNIYRMTDCTDIHQPEEKRLHTQRSAIDDTVRPITSG